MKADASLPSAQWLTDSYLEWQKQSGKRKTVTEFAEYLGVSRDVLNQWMNGRRTPGKESVIVIASKLGAGIYDALGLPRPDPLLTWIIERWGNFPNEQKRRLAAMLDAPTGLGVEDSFDAPMVKPNAKRKA